MSSRDPGQHSEFMNEAGLAMLKIGFPIRHLRSKIRSVRWLKPRETLDEQRGNAQILSAMRRPLFMRMRTSFPAALRSPILHTMSRTAWNRPHPTFDVMICQAWVRTCWMYVVVIQRNL